MIRWLSNVNGKIQPTAILCVWYNKLLSVQVNKNLKRAAWKWTVGENPEFPVQYWLLIAQTTEKKQEKGI